MSPLTPAERTKRYKDKQRLLKTASLVRGKGGLERLSEMVEARVKEGVAKGILTPTIADGLRAEKIMDARAAHMDDRQTSITLAMILSGASGVGPPARLLIGDGMEIEGEAEEIEDEDE